MDTKLANRIFENRCSSDNIQASHMIGLRTGILDYLGLLETAPLGHGGAEGISAGYVGFICRI